MTKLIDADETMKYIIERHCKECVLRKGVKNGKLRVLYDIGDAPCRACLIDDMKTMIYDAPAVEAEPVKHGKWIPFNEQKPKRAYTVEFLVTVKKGEDYFKVIIARWSSCGWGNDIYDAFCCPQQVTINNRPMYAYQPIPNDEVVAWMPLPSPYKGEEE